MSFYTQPAHKDTCDTDGYYRSIQLKQFSRYGPRLMSGHDPDKHFNHGKVWTIERKTDLINLFRQGRTLAEMEVELGRTQCSLLCKLEESRLIMPDSARRHYWAYPLNSGNKIDSSINTVKDYKMALNQSTQVKGIIENRVFVDGTPVSEISFDDMLIRISKLKARIASLQALGIQSKKVEAMIAKLTERLIDMVELLDSNYDEDGNFVGQDQAPEATAQAMDGTALTSAVDD